MNYEWPPLGGGAGPVARDLAREYVRQGHSVKVITMGFRGLPKHETVDGVEIHRVPALRRVKATCETHEMLSYVISAYLPARKLAKERAFDVVHCHFLIPTGLLAVHIARIAKVPLVITSHGSDIPGFNPDRFTWQHKITRPVLRYIAKHAHIVTPSNYLKGLFQKQVGDFPVKVIPNGIDVDRFNLQGKKKQILMTGRLLPRKGFQFVLQALEGIETDFEVHICGDGPARSELESLARKLTIPVHFHGWLPHDSKLLRGLYETSMIYCLPSSSENASIALLEAMLAGMAVITSNVTGCPETVADAGITLPYGDISGIRKQLVKLMKDKEFAIALGLQARKRVCDCFLWPGLAYKYYNLF